MIATILVGGIGLALRYAAPDFSSCYTPVLAFVESTTFTFGGPLIVVNGKVQTPDCVYERILPPRRITCRR
jgi:hypothetical protein